MAENGGGWPHGFLGSQAVGSAHTSADQQGQSGLEIGSPGAGMQEEAEEEAEGRRGTGRNVRGRWAERGGRGGGRGSATAVRNEMAEGVGHAARMEGDQASRSRTEEAMAIGGWTLGGGQGLATQEGSTQSQPPTAGESRATIFPHHSTAASSCGATASDGPQAPLPPPPPPPPQNRPLRAGEGGAVAEGFEGMEWGEVCQRLQHGLTQTGAQEFVHAQRDFLLLRDLLPQLDIPGSTGERFSSAGEEEEEI